MQIARRESHYNEPLQADIQKPALGFFSSEIAAGQFSPVRRFVSRISIVETAGKSILSFALTRLVASDCNDSGVAVGHDCLANKATPQTQVFLALPAKFLKGSRHICP